MYFNKKYKSKEFWQIVQSVVEINDFVKLKNYAHHGVDRLDHSLRVSYMTYKLTKFLHLNYKEATRAALLHDFFIDGDESNKKILMVSHPQHAVERSKKYFDLTDLEEDIIASHMFPVAPRIPKYIESWIVDILDNIAGAIERTITMKTQFATSVSFLAFILLTIV